MPSYPSIVIVPSHGGSGGDRDLLIPVDEMVLMIDDVDDVDTFIVGGDELFCCCCYPVVR